MIIVIYLANISESLLYVRHFAKPAEGNKDV